MSLTGRARIFRTKLAQRHVGALVAAHSGSSAENSQTPARGATMDLFSPVSNWMTQDIDFAYFGEVTGMHPNESLARREIDLIRQGDAEGHRHLYTDGCVFHYPGKSPLAGAHRGLPEFMARLEEVFYGATITRELHDALGSDNHAAQLLRVTATVGGRSHTWRVVWVMHVADGQFSEAWAYVDDQYALDAFLNSLGVHSA